MLTLYHFGGAICAQKVRLALAEKGVEWDSRECSGPTLRDPEYLRLNPNGVVPTLVHDEKVIRESRIISEYIDEAFDGPALMPSHPLERHGARLWSKQIDDSLHLNVFILTFASMAREMFLAMPPEVRANAMPGLRDPVKRRISHELLESDMRSPWIKVALDRFIRLANEMEEQLSRTQYLAGGFYSLADADYTAYINRLSDVGLESLWLNKPALNRWRAEMWERPSYHSAIVNWQSPQDTASYARARDLCANAMREYFPA
ncbi:MAG: glutathione S-transferase family protein [Sphingobium sp.]